MNCILYTRIIYATALHTPPPGDGHGLYPAPRPVVAKARPLLDHEIHQGTTMGCSSTGGARVDASESNKSPLTAAEAKE